MAKKDWMIMESDIKDDDQLNILRETNEKSLVVKGCAGSGKSFLALIKAQRIQKEKGNNYKVLVFTKALCKYMNEGKKSLELNNDFDYYWDWKYNQNCPSADYIIVDEIQDFSKEEIEEFISATKKNFFFYGDTAQSIYNGIIENGKTKVTLPVENIRDLLSNNNKPKEFELYRNYRLPLGVAKVVQHIGVGLDGFCENTYKSKELSIPKIIRYNNLEEQVRSIVNIKDNSELTDVGILVHSNEDVKTVSNLLNKLACNHELKYKDKENWKNSIDNLDFTTNNPKVMTYHSAKGLQFETVFLPNMVQPGGVSQQKALYVAMTRTYRDLYIMYSGNLQYPLNQIPNDLYKTTEVDEIDEI